jgi:hypothetical protein
VRIAAFRARAQEGKASDPRVAEYLQARGPDFWGEGGGAAAAAGAARSFWGDSCAGKRRACARGPRCRRALRARLVRQPQPNPATEPSRSGALPPPCPARPQVLETKDEAVKEQLYEEAGLL